jgi:YesN/AraC family two-component response regulator
MINDIQIERVGEYPILNAVHEFSYQTPTHAIHLYNYHSSLKIEETHYSILPGSMTFIPAGKRYSFQSQENGKHWCIHWHDRDLQMELPTLLELKGASVFFKEQLKQISSLFNTTHPNNRVHDLEKKEAFYRFLALLESLKNLNLQVNLRAKRSSKSFSWIETLQWINKNLHRPIHRDEIAQKLNLSPHTAAIKFKKEHKISINQYLLKQRIEKAQSLLTTTALTIKEIGTAVSIEDPQYFNKQFRKVTGMSPSKYRDNNQEFLSSLKFDKIATDLGNWLE